MTVNINKGSLTPVAPTEKVLPSRLTALYGRLNYLYEQLLGVTAPYKSGASEYGHDHSYRRGGRILPRYRQLSFLRPFGVEVSPKTFTLTPSTPLRLTFPYFSTQGLLGEGEARLCLRCTPQKKLEVRETNYPYPTEFVGVEPSSFTWIAMPIRRPQGRIVFEIRSLEDANFEVSVMGLLVTEKAEQTERSGVVMPSDARQTENNNTRFEILNDSFVTQGGGKHYWLDAHSLSIAANTANALFELTFDKASPINASQAVKGHDHGARGGALVARGGLYSVETEDEDSPVFTRGGYSSSTWLAVSSTRDHHAYPYVSKGVNSGASPFDTAPALEVFLKVKCDPSLSFDFRVSNSTASKTSQPVTAGATGLASIRYVNIPNVPAQEGLNLLQVQARYTGGSPQTIDILGIEVYERDGVCMEGGTSSP